VSEKEYPVQRPTSGTIGFASMFGLRRDGAVTTDLIIR
jgi:hypothetical protein